MGVDDSSSNRVLFGTLGSLKCRGLLQFCGRLEYDFSDSSNGLGITSFPKECRGTTKISRKESSRHTALSRHFFSQRDFVSHLFDRIQSLRSGQQLL